MEDAVWPALAEQVVALTREDGAELLAQLQATHVHSDSDSVFSFTVLLESEKRVRNLRSKD